MAPLADFLLAHIPYRLPTHLYSYVEGSTPLSTTSAVLAALTSYLAIVFGIQAVMKNQPPQKLTRPFQLHNIILCLGSLVLLALILEEIAPIFWQHGMHYALCNELAWTPRLEFYYMVNYSFKYLELLDTVFLALKKKPLKFLHVFHHSATALLCFTQLNGKTSISWTVISLNLIVHIVMYYYFYATAGGAKFWWKKYLTTMQIIQFIIDLFIVYFGTYEHFVFSYRRTLPHFGNCAGSEQAAFFGCALLTTYLGLFINFYFQTYRKPSANPNKASTDEAVNGKANGFVSKH